MFCTYLYIIHEPVHFPRPKHSEHGLTNVERVPPVVITDGSVIFLDAQHPAAQGLKVQVILFEIDCAIFYKKLHELFCQFIT